LFGGVYNYKGVSSHAFIPPIMYNVKVLIYKLTDFEHNFIVSEIKSNTFNQDILDKEL
jgi:hypothetical protein